MTSETALQEAYNVDRIISRQRAYIEAISPLMKCKSEIYSLKVPTMIIHRNGEIEHRYDFDEVQKEDLRLIDEMIESVKRQFEAIDHPRKKLGIIC